MKKMKKIIDTEYYNGIYYTIISIESIEVKFITTSKSNIDKIIKIINNNFDYSHSLEFSGLKEVKEYFNI